MIRPFVLRRLKKDVLRDLPEKLEENMYTRLEGEQQTVAPGAEGIQNRQGGVHGGALSDHLHQLLAQALLHVLDGRARVM